jgi:transcriptional regulator with XRE-family HTH domain
MREPGLDGVRLKAFRELKGFRSQKDLAELVGVSQPHICDMESGKLRNPAVFLRVADELDCTTDFLFRRGPFKDAEKPEEVREAASQMAFDLFVERLDVSVARKQRCARVLGHPDAPLTMRAWKSLAEMIDRALGDAEPPRIGRVSA